MKVLETKTQKHLIWQEFLKVIADSNRLQILQLVMHNELCVCKIYQKLHLPQNLVSHHLKVLKENNLITCRREKNWKHYRANQKVIESYLNQLQSYLLSTKEEITDYEC